MIIYLESVKDLPKLDRIRIKTAILDSGSHGYTVEQAKRGSYVKVAHGAFKNNGKVYQVKLDIGDPNNTEMFIMSGENK